MPIQSVEYWEGKAQNAEEMADEMDHGPARQAMLELAEFYRKHAEQTAKLVATESRKK